jgi:hypothetical protein
MLGKYTRIERVKYDNMPEHQAYCYLLTADGLDALNLEVDLESDCYFNTEYLVSKRTKAAEVHCLQDILDFTKNFMHIDISDHYKDGCLIVGGSNDCKIHDNLEFEWID